MKILKGLLLWLVFLSLAPMVIAEGESQGGYKLLKKIHLGGDGGWDCMKVDTNERRLFVTHDTKVQVIDVDKMKLIGTVEGTQRAHAVAWAQELEMGFVSSGGTNSILVFDLDKFTKKGEIKTGTNPDAIVYDRASDRVLAFNGEDGTATIADAATQEVLATLPLAGKPETAVTDGRGLVYDNLEDKNQVVQIDARNSKILNRWPIGPGDSPAGLALDRKNGRLFIGCRNQVMVVLDTHTGKVIQTVPIGKGVDATVFDHESGIIYNSCGDGTLTVIHQDDPAHYSVTETVKTQQGSRTMAVDSKTGHLFLAAAQFGPQPTPTSDNPKPRRKILPGTFEILVFGK